MTFIKRNGGLIGPAHCLCDHTREQRRQCQRRVAGTSDDSLFAIRNSGNVVPYSIKSAHNMSRITNRQTISWDVFSHHTTRANNGAVSDAKAGKDYHVRADPDVIFDGNWCRWRRHLTLFYTMLVPVYDKRMMTQQTMAADLDLFVCRNRCAVVNKGMIAYRDASTFVGDEFDRDDVAH